MSAALFMAGCATPVARDDGAALVDIPANWSAANARPDVPVTELSAWWQHFHDPLLSVLVERAVQHNTSVNSAEAALRQARALRDVAGAALLPAVGGSASAQHNTAGDDSHSKLFRAGLDASWELDIFGANRQALAAGNATVEAAEAALGNVQVSIAAEVALGFITLRGSEARLAIATANLDSQLETLQIARWRREAGLVTALETEQARASTEQLRAQLPLLQTSIEQSRHALAVLTGQPPAALLVSLAAPGAIPQPDQDIALQFPADTLRQRPDVRAAERRLAAALARVDQARAARLPDFRLSGSLGLNAITLGTLGNAASLTTAVLAAVSMPLFDGGAGSAQVRAQQAAMEQSRQDYRAALLAALADVENALVALRGNRARLDGLMNAADAAAIAAELARQRFSSGLVDFQTVLDTQRAQLSAQDSVAAARAEIGAGHVRLYKALGGGWQAGARPPMGPNQLQSDNRKPIS